MKYYVSLLTEPNKKEFFEVQKEVFVYIKQLEAYIRNESKSTVRDDYYPRLEGNRQKIGTMHSSDVNKSS